MVYELNAAEAARAVKELHGARLGAIAGAVKDGDYDEPVFADAILDSLLDDIEAEDAEGQDGQ